MILIASYAHVAYVVCVTPTANFTLHQLSCVAHWLLNAFPSMLTEQQCTVTESEAGDENLP
jgi:hypothetical protein